MEYLELSIEKSIEESEKLYNRVKEDYDFDLVIFIAKGSYIIGKKISELGNTPLLEIYATRQGNKLKKLISPMLKIIPRKILIKLREKEVKSGYHEKTIDRNVSFNTNEWQKFQNTKKILLVDDSADTGWSIFFAKQKIKEFFVDADIRIAVFNYFEKCKDVISINYNLYKDTMIQGPWSNDSKEYTKFIELYKKWKDSYEG